MTDYEQLTHILDQAGIPYRKRTAAENQDAYQRHTPPTTYLHIRANSHTYEPAIGYPGFYTELCFDANGKLTNVGIWE